MAKEIFRAAVDAANPYRGVARACDEIHSLFREGGFARLHVVGFGKASPAMASALEESLGGLIDDGIIITKYGHTPSRKLERIRLFESGHPIPDENGQEASRRLVNLVESADDRTLVISLISGGGSALLVSPLAGITLVDKQVTTDLLLKAGADIHDLNTVRKHLSRVKGGRLAELIYPATSFSLILSDVVGDRLDVIASGPTAPDPTTYRDALDVLVKYNLAKTAPVSVAELLAKGQIGKVPETPKPGNPLFSNTTNMIIGSNRRALEAAQGKAEGLGFRTEVLSAEISGEARDVGRWLARKALVVKRSMGMQSPVCLISGGETTVTVKGKGKGGRNMELALSFALEVEGIAGITLLSAGTDGTDGPTDAAGAVVDGNTTLGARRGGIDPELHLRYNNSYDFFRRTGGLLLTGATGTNVMDIQMILIEGNGPLQDNVSMR